MLTPDTKWEEGMQIGGWFFEDGWCLYNSYTDLKFARTLGYIHYRRLNPPAQDAIK